MQLMAKTAMLRMNKANSADDNASGCGVIVDKVT